MTATFRVINRRVGEGGQKSGPDLLRIQQLLARVLMLDEREISGVWDNATKKAVLTLQEQHDIPKDRCTEYLDPSDPSGVIFEMLWDADVLLQLPHPKCGPAALDEFFTTALHRHVPYGWANLGTRDHLAWGLEGHPNYLIFTTPFQNGDYYFDQESRPITMNCISFTNLALSIWRTGNAHAPPYDVRQDSGGWDAVGRRYGMSYRRNPTLVAEHAAAAAAAQPDWSYHPVPLRDDKAASTLFYPHAERVHLGQMRDTAFGDTYFYTPQEVLDVAKPFEVYQLQWCYMRDLGVGPGRHQSGFSHHDTVLYNKVVYEINQYSPFLFRRPLIERWNGEPMRLVGPLLE